MLLAPGTYNSITMVAGDMDVAVVPPSGSHQPIQVIGQASEGLIETGTFASDPPVPALRAGQRTPPQLRARSTRASWISTAH